MRNSWNMGITVGITMGMLIITLFVVVPLKNRINSLAEAVNQLQICIEDGMDNCHIELDGNQYNVYGEKL